MKKFLAVILIFALVFCFAACSKKGEKYEPPQMTEVITFEDGSTAIYEIVTEENGEVATDEEGGTKYVPYIPPVTEEGGYLVTDAQGSTIPDVQTVPSAGATTAGTNVDIDIGEFDEPTDSNKTTKPDSTAKPDSTTKPTATTKPNSTTKPTATTKPVGTTAAPESKPTAPPATKPLDGELTPAKAQKLVNLLEGLLDNPFDEDLAEADFYAAEKSLEVYIADVENVIAQIKADKALYEFVGNEKLNSWLNYLAETKDNYAKFMTMVEHEEGKTEKNPLYYKAYTDFQESYKGALEIYYFVLFAAQDRA